MMDTSLRHFLDIDKLDTDVVRAILMQAKALKKTPWQPQRLPGKTLVSIFEKNSTRTRVSFQVGMQQLGGMVVEISSDSSQLGRGETIPDTARVLSGYADIIMIRTDGHDRLLELAAHAAVPVINGLTDDTHPCQVMADLLTLEERKGRLDQLVVAWCGDGNNVAHSWIHAARHFDFELRLGCPQGHQANAAILRAAMDAGARLRIMENAEDTVRAADVVLTDTWVSMGQTSTDSHHDPHRVFEPWQVNAPLMALAKEDAVFMHCLPAHRGEEVTDEVMDGPQSAVWDEAENRLHVQKSIILWCLKQF